MGLLDERVHAVADAESLDCFYQFRLRDAHGREGLSTAPPPPEALVPSDVDRSMRDLAIRRVGDVRVGLQASWTASPPSSCPSLSETIARDLLCFADSSTPPRM